MKADLDLIDLNALRINTPEIDSPAGTPRFMQTAQGHVATSEEIAASVAGLLEVSERRRRHNDLIRQPLNVTLHSLDIARDRANDYLLHASVRVLV